MTAVAPGARLHRVEHLMGMAITLELGVCDERLADEVFAWLRLVDQRFSTYREDSEVSRLGRGEIAVADCCPDVAAVVDRCADLWRDTDGYFDAYAARRLDPSGYVKGWAVQVASDRLLAAGIGDHCLNAGGDLRVRGTAASGRPWRIGIRHPWRADAVCWVLSGTDLAVATSGVYERGRHVLDPRTGEPAVGLRSVTVVGADLGTADAYATAALAMGAPGIDWLATVDGYASAVVTDDGRCFRSPDLPLAPDVPDRGP